MNLIGIQNAGFTRDGVVDPKTPRSLRIFTPESVQIERPLDVRAIIRVRLNEDSVSGSSGRGEKTGQLAAISMGNVERHLNGFQRGRRRDVEGPREARIIGNRHSGIDWPSVEFGERAWAAAGLRGFDERIDIDKTESIIRIKLDAGRIRFPPADRTRVRRIALATRDREQMHRPTRVEIWLSLFR